MKNKVAIVILALIMIVPTVVAIINYNLEQSGEVSTANVVSMTLVDPNGNTYAFSREGTETEKAMLEYFAGVKASSEEIEKLPAAVEEGAHYLLNAKTTASETTYKFYFSGSAEDCYFVDGDGKSYRMKEKDGKYFLESSYAAELYEYGKAPNMIVAGSELVPDSGSWRFVNVSGNYIDSIVFVKDELENVILEGGLNLEFEVNPDLLDVKIVNKAKNEIIFEGSYDDISKGVEIEENMLISVEAHAKWYEDKTRTYYGEQTYNFEARVNAQIEFYAGVKSVEIGEFVCITAVNMTESSKLEFSSSPDIGYTPEFTKVGDYYYALIPFNNELEIGNYVLDFDLGGYNRTLNIEVTERGNKFGTREKQYADAVIKSYYSDDVIKKAQDALLPIAEAKASENEMFFEGDFLEVVDGTNVAISAGYGHTINIKGTDKSFVHTGVEYSAPATTAVVAANNGKVVYAGYLDHTGYIVVIDHGLGLRGWYCHLSEISVKEGDTVNKGDTVGKCGGTGFSNETGVHIGYTVYATPVCQYTLWSDGNNKGIPVYTPN